MESRRKLLVTALLSCAIVAGVSLWLVRGASANRTAPTSERAQAPGSAAARAITLQAEGRSSRLRYQNSADLEGSEESEGAGRAVAVTAGSVFGSGWRDMVSLHVSGADTNVQVRAGTSTGGYETPATYSLPGMRPAGVEIGDFNADGRSDIAVLDQERAT